MDTTGGYGEPGQDSVKSLALYESAGKEKDCNKAIQLYEQSAEFGNPEAMHKLALIYEGNGFEKTDNANNATLANFDKTLYWLRQAVNAKNVEAMYDYGSLLNGSEISSHFSVPDEYIKKDSAKYYWDYSNANTAGGVKPYAKPDLNKY